MTCPSCGASNRVRLDASHSGQEPVCGRCKTPLNSTAKPLIVTDATFAAEIERSQLPVLLDMWAAWCGPCRTLAPIIDQLAQELAGRVRVAKLNIDENPAAADRYGVRSIPTLLLLQGGREIDRIVGVQPRPEIMRRLQAAGLLV